MPGTYRYSATFDRTYEEDSPLSADDRSRSKNRQPSYGRSLSDHGSRNDHHRSASTDSLDSMYGSGGSSTSHSRQASADNTEHIPTRRITKVTAKPAHNPLQFVKVGAPPLYRKEMKSHHVQMLESSNCQNKPEQTKKVAKEKLKEDEEEWQLNLDSWKNRRRKQSEGSLLRLEEIRRIELEEQERKHEEKKVKTKTFSEMMEERAHRPKQYNLVIYGRPSSEDEDTDNVSCTKSDSNDDSDKGNSDSTLCSNNVEENTVNGRQSTSDETLPENEKIGEVSRVCHEQTVKRSHHNNVENNFTGINEYMILEKRMMKEKLLSGNGCANTDSGLDSLSSSHKAGDLADSASDFSQDSGSSLDSDFQHMTGSLTTGVELLEEFSSNSLSNYEKKTDNGIELFLRIWLKQGSDSKDFGFVLKEGKDQSTPIVHSVIPGGVGDLAGLRKGDQVLAINGECTEGHENEVMSFAVQQAIYSGHLDLLIWRPTDTDSETNGVGRERSNSIVLQRKSAFENGTQQKKSAQRTSKDIRPAVDFKEKVSSFERRSSVEQEISNLVSKPVTSRKPPLVPNKPRLRSKSVPDASIYQRTNGVHKYASLPEDEDTLDDNVCDANNSNGEVVVNNSNCVNSSNQLTSNTTTEENCDNSHESAKNTCNVQNDLQPSENKTDATSEELTRKNHDSNDKMESSPTMNCENEISQSQWLINLNPVQESGLNIIYDSHPVQENKKKETSSSSSESEQSTSFQQSNKKGNKATKNQKCENKTVDNSVKLADKAKCDKTAENKQNPKKVKKEQNQEDMLKFECDDLLNSDIYEIPLSLIQDDLLFADLDISSRQLEPPKEKPPPPPSNESDIESSENAPAVRANTTKEIKRELWKRRSNFLGIESEDHSGEVDDSHIPPPPSIEDILKSERKLERENRQLLEQQTLIRLQKLAEEEEIARKEREIIENIEREERERQRQEEERQNILTKEENMPTSEKNKEQEKQQLHNKHQKQNLEKSKSAVSKQEKQTPKLQDQQILQEREEYIKQQEKPEKPGSKQSNTSKNSSSLSQNNSSVVETKNSTPPNKVPTKKMILRQERERLRREQEALQKQWEEYEQQTKLQQQIWLQQKAPQSSTQQKSHSISSARQNKVPNPMPASHTQTKHELVERDNIINASRRPQATPTLPEEEPNSKDIVENEHPGHNIVPPSQALTKRSLHSLGAAPKAKIVNNEQWIKPNEKVTKRRIESVAESRYNQYHWLVQEAEMRRITEQKERQHQRTSEHRSVHSRANASTVPVPLHTQNNNSIYHNTQKQSLNHPTHCALPCGYSLEPQWNRNNSGTNVRHSRLSQDKNQCIGYTNSQRDASPIKPPRTLNSNNQEHLLSVSGRKRCSHCGEELGRGAAMIIESLQLFYHIQCFCCCVCQAQLGNGSCGTDVRVRNNKLHCQHCYSNDEAGLKFSQV